jgi:hypothetical protein
MADEVEVLAPSEGVQSEPVAPPTTTEVDEQIAQPVEGQPVEGTPSTEEEQEVDLDAVPESSGDFAAYKPLFKDHPELKTILGREQAFSDIAPNGSFSELKGIVERVPTLEDAETLATQAENLRALGETFRRDPAAFTESLKENDPLAYQQWVKNLPQVLADSDPTSYTEQARFYSNAVLDNLFAAAQRTGNEQALISLQNVAAMLGVQLGTPRMEVRGNSEVEKLRRQLAEREQADTSAQAASFWDGTVQEHVSNSMSEIESLIRKSIPTVSDGQLKRMAGEVWDGVNVKLASQPQTMAQINQFKANVAKGRMSVSDHKAIVDYTMKRTKQIIPLVWKDVSSEWSKQILAFNKEQIEKKKGVTPTPAPVASAPQRSTPAKPAPKSTFNKVFDALRSGTYSKPAARA